MIKEILHKLETSAHPVAHVLHHNDHFKVLILAFKAGMILKEHTAKLPSKLTVVEGSVEYRENDKIIKAEKFDTIEIPVLVTHAVHALEDSICILTQG